jgi:hypothetical protein
MPPANSTNYLIVKDLQLALATRRRGKRRKDLVPALFTGADENRLAHRDRPIFVFDNRGGAEIAWSRIIPVRRDAIPDAIQAFAIFPGLQPWKWILALVTRLFVDSLALHS